MCRIIIFLLSFLLMGCSVKQDNTDYANQNIDLKSAAYFNVKLGMSYLQQGQTERAKEKLLLALDQAPNLPETQTAMGYFLLMTGNEKRANIYYERALKLAPNSGIVQNHYGVFLCRTGNYKKAISHFLLAANDQQYLNTRAAYENAGLCALKIPDKKLANYYFEKALTCDLKRR